MPIKVRKAQTNFIRGEFQPEMFGRHDFYENGAQNLQNMSLLIQGGVRTRPPLAYQATLNQNQGKLAPFVFNDEQRYGVVFSNARADFYKASTADSSYSLVASSTNAPWTTAMLPQLSFTHFGDTMLVFHEDLHTQVIERTGSTSFTRTALTFEKSSTGADKTYQPYYKFAASTMTLTPSTGGAGSTATLTLSSPGAWTTSHVGFRVRYREKEIEITSATSATVAKGVIKEALPSTTSSLDWDEAVFSDARGYAKHGEFHNSRLWLFGAKSRPTGRWFSKVGAFYNFDLGTQQDDEASWEAIESARIAEIRYGVSGRHMTMFANTGVYLQPETQSRPITPDNADSIEQGQIGTAYVKPQFYDGGIVFCHKEGQAVSEMRYNDVDQAYQINPLSHTAGHLISSPTAIAPVLDSTSRQEQYCVLQNSDGNLSVLHSNEREGILGWTPWKTTGTFKDVCAVGKDLLTLVERTLDSSTLWTLERLDDSKGPLDCAITATSTSTSGLGKTFNGFTLFANETVNVVSNGHSLGTYTVSTGGAITLGDLDPQVATIDAGLAFQQRIKPMPAVFDLPDGESRGEVLGLVRAHIEVDRTAAFQVAGEDILLNFAGDSFTSTAATKTGILTVHSLGYDEDAAPTFVINNPERVTILGITREVEVNE